MNNVLLSSLLIISSILLSNLALYGIRKREIPGALLFSVLMIGMVIESVGYAFELLSNTVEGMYFWVRIEHIGTAFYPTLIMLFAREYTDEKKIANKYILKLLLMINIVTLVLVNTNSYHLLYYASLGVDSSQGFNVLALEKGDWYFVQMIALYFSMLYSIIILIIKLKKSRGNYRKRITFVLIGLTIPMITFSIYVFGLGPLYIYLSPFSYLFMSLFIFFGLSKHNKLFFIPITHEMIFNSIDEAVLVVDNDKLLVSFNRASKLFFPSLNNIKAGESIDLVSELKECNFNLNEKIYEIDDKILNFKIIHMGNDVGSIYVIKDITKWERAKKQLEIFATEDALTGLYNRRYFMENFDGSEEDGVFVMMDIDYFKSINDTFGHGEGDNVLSYFGENIRMFFNEHKVCRYGGEEFALFIENKDIKEVFNEVEAFREKIQDQECTTKFTFCAGLAKYKKGHISEAIIEADKMLYKAKENGRNQIRY